VPSSSGIGIDVSTAPSVSSEKPGAPELPTIQGEVIFEDVNFAYAPKLPVLQGINLHVKPGQLVALVGATGPGQSTLVKLLNRSYEVVSGRLPIDGHDMRDVEQGTHEELLAQRGLYHRLYTMGFTTVRLGEEAG
jgi:ABC-type multidrug transport system fused ATPase/permease subunit